MPLHIHPSTGMGGGPTCRYLCLKFLHAASSISSVTPIFCLSGFGAIPGHRTEKDNFKQNQAVLRVMCKPLVQSFDLAPRR
eukprot:3777469-Amphidinium_carterae.1